MVVGNGYVPAKGDLVWLDFDSQAGHEQNGRRPALIISQGAYNEKVGLAILCPVTSKEKGYPFEVKLTGKTIVGCVLSDQVKTLDWKVRNIEFIEKADNEVTDRAIELLELILN